MRTIIRVFVILTLLSPLHGVACSLTIFALSSERAIAAIPLRRDQSGFREEVARFLATWLKARDTTGTLQFFSESAFSNQDMFNESCSGYIKQEDRRVPEAIRSGVESFLVDFQKCEFSKDNPLVEKLKALTAETQKGKHRELNDVNSDGFLLLHLPRKELDALSDDGEAGRFLHEHAPPDGYYASIIPIGDGVVYFFWIREKANWKIYHAGMVCR